MRNIYDKTFRLNLLNVRKSVKIIKKKITIPILAPLRAIVYSQEFSVRFTQFNKYIASFYYYN